jgi:hypothetical protein
MLLITAMNLVGFLMKKKVSGNRTMSLLSFTAFSNPGHLNRISALELDFLAM